MGIAIGTRVEIVKASTDTGRTGVVVAGGMWNNGTSADRVVRMDDTGERLVFESWMMIPEEGDVIAELSAAADAVDAAHETIDTGHMASQDARLAAHQAVEHFAELGRRSILGRAALRRSGRV